MNESQVTTTKPLIDFDNTAVTITLIIALGVWSIYKTYTDAKYNRETFFSYDDEKGFTFVSRPATVNTEFVCPA